VSSGRIAVCLEVAPKRTFACALDWPGWCRAGRDEDTAPEALASYARRYAPVAGQARVSFPSTVAFHVVERMPGGPATAFAAPECRRPFPQITAEAERAKVTPAAARRRADLVTAAWMTFDEIAAASLAELPKGPRGGGRDRDEIIGHVSRAETAYARKLGVKLKQSAIGDIAAIEELREGIAAVVGAERRASSRSPTGSLSGRTSPRRSSGASPRTAACLSEPEPGPDPGPLAQPAQAQPEPGGKFAERARRDHTTVHERLAEGHGIRTIARHLGWGRHTVQR